MTEGKFSSVYCQIWVQTYIPRMVNMQGLFFGNCLIQMQNSLRSWWYLDTKHLLHSYSSPEIQSWSLSSHSHHLCRQLQEWLSASINAFAACLDDSWYLQPKHQQYRKSCGSNFSPCHWMLGLEELFESKQWLPCTYLRCLETLPLPDTALEMALSFLLSSEQQALQW